MSQVEVWAWRRCRRIVLLAVRLAREGERAGQVLVKLLRSTFCYREQKCCAGHMFIELDRMDAWRGSVEGFDGGISC